MSKATVHAIIGTAGHIDHGKTALVKALTGQDTDRLKEEKDRGISIELGFAYLTLPDGTRAGLVDVPGHERFIRNMLAGAHGIDLVLFTVAADDGVMPQSEEHMDILHLLGVRRGVLVITKADLAGPERLAEVRAEVELLVEGTTLAGAPVMAVSALTGAGLEELKAEVARQLAGFVARRPTGIFRLPVDRVFAVKGHGTVVTGTAAGAEVRVGQQLRLLPGGELVRVRAIQVHGEPAESAGLCQRVALNLSTGERARLERGSVLAEAALDLTTQRLDVLLQLRRAGRRPLRSNDRVRLFLGTAETAARVSVLDPSGEAGGDKPILAQFITRHPLVALGQDRIIIRDETNQRTLGGATVLNPLGRKARGGARSQIEWLSRLQAAQAPADALEAMLNLQQDLAVSALRLSQLLNRPQADVASALGDRRFIVLNVAEEQLFTTPAKWRELEQFVAAAVAEHHRANPLSPGLEMEQLRVRLPYAVTPRAFRLLLDRLAESLQLVRQESLVRLKQHRVELGGEDQRLGIALEKTLKDSGFKPPDLRQLAQSCGLGGAGIARARCLLTALERDGRVVKVATDLYFSRQAVEQARQRLLDYLGSNAEIGAAGFRDLIGGSRKFAIALLDYFDHTAVTTRVGDMRRLRARSG